MIYDYSDDGSWLPIIAAVFVIEALFIPLTKSISENGRTWYGHFGIVSILADVGIILLGFAASRYVFAAYGLGSSYTPWQRASIFSATLLWMQIVHDVIYYFVFITGLLASSSNGIVSFMKKYGSEGKLWPIAGDSAMMVSAGLLAHALSTMPNHAIIIVLIAAIYVIPYMISPKYSAGSSEHHRKTVPVEQPRVPQYRRSSGVIVCNI